jgi:hypothetical protein
MTANGVSFDVEAFEQVAAGSGMALLRVVGRWRADDATALGPPTLIVDDGRDAHRLDALTAPGAAPLAAGPGGGTPWRGAFSAPSALLEQRRIAFALDAGGAVVDLPRPEPSSETAEGAESAGDEAEALRGRILERRILELEHRLAAELDRRAELEARIEALRRPRAARTGARFAPESPPPPSWLPPEYVVGAVLLLVGATLVLVLMSGVLGKVF